MMLKHSPSFYLAAALRLTGLIMLRFIAFVWVRKRNEIVIGGWWGNLFIDNPKYLLLYLLEHTDFKVTWVGSNEVCRQLPEHENLSFVRKGSLLAIWRLLNARTWVCCQAIHLDLTTLPILGRACCVDLWHGILIKYIGGLAPGRRGLVDHTGAALRESYLARLYQKWSVNLTSWVVVSNRKMVDILCDGEPLRYNRSRVLCTGTPRNDFLINNSSNQSLIAKLRHKYSRLLGFDESKKIVMYLPTWRMRGDCVFAFYNQTFETQKQWGKLLRDYDAVLIEKHHYGTYARYPNVKQSICSIVISAEQQHFLDVQELLLITDILISDYSGAYIDFGLLKRPVIHFAYDLEEYSAMDSGLAYELADVAAGPIVSSVAAMKEALIEQLKHPKFCPAHGFLQLVEFEKGTAAKQIVGFIQS